MATSQFQLFRSDRFLPLFVTQFLGAFNDNLLKNALIIMFTYVAISDATIPSQQLVTLAAGLFILPFLLFSAIAGQLADKFEKSMLIRRVKLFEVGLMVLASSGLLLSNTYLLLGVLFLMGTQSAFFGPLKYGILPDHLREDELIGGNALVEAGTFVSILIGTICGGLLVKAPYGAELASGVLLLIAVTGWLAACRIPLAPSAIPDLKINWNFIGETFSMIRQTRKRKILYRAILGISWFWFVGATFLTQIPSYAKNTLGADEQVVTLFLALFSLGIAVGSLLCNRLLRGIVTARFVFQLPTSLKPFLAASSERPCTDGSSCDSLLST